MGCSEGNGGTSAFDCPDMYNLYFGQETTVRTDYGETWFPTDKAGRQGCILSPHLSNLYTEHTRMTGLDRGRSEN